MKGKPKNGIKVDEGSIIYHLENDTKDTNGGNAGNFTFIPNTDNPFIESNMIKEQNTAYNGTVTKISKKEDICIFTNSNTVRVGTKLIQLKDEQLKVRDDVDYWNNILGNKFNWEE